MSQKLRELLIEYADKHHAQFEAYRRRREEWIEAIRRLLTQLRRWLTEADPKGALQIEDCKDEIIEEPLGRYKVPMLVVSMGAREVEIKPWKRSPDRPRDLDLGGNPEGRVDLTKNDHFSERNLYRILGEEGERWVMVNREKRTVTPLTQETFEDAMARLLS